MAGRISWECDVWTGLPRAKGSVRLGTTYVRASNRDAAVRWVLERHPLPSMRKARYVEAYPWNYQDDRDFKVGACRIIEFPRAAPGPGDQLQLCETQHGPSSQS